MHSAEACGVPLLSFPRVVRFLWGEAPGLKLDSSTRPSPCWSSVGFLLLITVVQRFP